MAKYIDADALLKKLKVILHRYPKVYARIESVIYDDMPAADVEPVRKWIPCSECLPEPGTNVLIYKKWEGKVVHRIIFDILISQMDCDGKWRDEYGVYKINGTAVAWMPLPEPPKMDGGSE